MGPAEIRHRLTDGETVFGTMAFEFNTSGLSAIAAEAGASFVLYDMEHTGWSIESIRAQMGWSKASDITRLVRVPSSRYEDIARALDVGAQGIMVPMVESADQASQIAASMTYPPHGRRGAAFGIMHDHYSGGGPADKMSYANETRLCIAQIETVAGVDAVDEIAAVPGVDVLWVGQYDLTLSMGIPAEWDNPRFPKALERVATAAKANGKIAGAMALSVEDARLWISRGFTMIAYWGDLWIYGQALKSALDQLKD
jgi:2-keto-3-deoxy-L-rhamnonate aldolase RhmA